MVLTESMTKAIVVIAFLVLSYYMSGPFGAVSYTCGLLIGRYLKNDARVREEA